LLSLKGLNFIRSPNAVENASEFLFNGVKINNFLSLSKRKYSPLCRSGLVEIVSGRGGERFIVSTEIVAAILEEIRGKPPAAGPAVEHQEKEPAGKDPARLVNTYSLDMVQAARAYLLLDPRPLYVRLASVCALGAFYFFRASGGFHFARELGICDLSCEARFVILVVVRPDVLEAHLITVESDLLDDSRE